MLNFELVSIASLIPHEKVDIKHMNTIKNSILKEEKILNPIIVDKNSKVILDGHHRYNASKKLKMKKIPTVLIDYFNDNIKLKFRREEFSHLSKNEIISSALNKKLFPNKTTKHIFNFK